MYASQAIEPIQSLFSASSRLNALLDKEQSQGVEDLEGIVAKRVSWFALTSTSTTGSTFFANCFGVTLTADWAKVSK